MSKQKEKSDAKAELNDVLESPLRQKFAIAFAENGGNGTKAATSAGYAHPAVEAVRLLKDAKVLSAISRHAHTLLTNASESRETILAAEVNWRNCNIQDYFHLVPILDNDGEPAIDPITRQPRFTEEMIPVSRLEPHVARRIKKLSWNREGPVLELHDPGRANRHLAEYAGMLKQKVSDMTPVEAASLIHEALKEMDEVDGISEHDDS